MTFPAGSGCYLAQIFTSKH